MTNWDLEYDKNFETHRHNVAMESIDRDRLSETHRSNIANENIGMLNWRESNRHNELVEQETARHNVAQERQAMDELAWKKAAHGYEYALKKGEFELKQQQHNLDLREFNWKVSQDAQKQQNWEQQFKHTKRMNRGHLALDAINTGANIAGQGVGMALKVLSVAKA